MPTHQLLFNPDYTHAPVGVPSPVRKPKFTTRECRRLVSDQRQNIIKISAYFYILPKNDLTFKT
jgi:hypothetical protein